MFQESTMNRFLALTLWAYVFLFIPICAYAEETSQEKTKEQDVVEKSDKSKSIIRRDRMELPISEFPLHAACVSHDPKLLDTALMSGADVDKEWYWDTDKHPGEIVHWLDGCAALHLAVIEHWPEGVKALLEAGANPNAVTRKGHFYPIHLINGEEAEKNLECLKLLIKYGADVNAMNAWSDCALLSLAVRMSDGIAPAITMMHNAGAIPDPEGQDPNRLIWAIAVTGQPDGVEAVGLILRWWKQINVNAIDDSGEFGDPGYTALLYATSTAHFELVQGLVEQGADPTAITPDGQNALHLMLNGDVLNPPILQGVGVLLLGQEEGANLKRSLSALGSLLDAGVPPNGLNADGKTPLDCFVESTRRYYQEGDQKRKTEDILGIEARTKKAATAIAKYLKSHGCKTRKAKEPKEWSDPS